VPILDTPGVVSIIRAGKRLLPLDDAEIDAVRKASESCLPVEPWTWVGPGQEVTITDGPLRGISGLLISVNRSERLLISVSLLRRALTVEIEPSWIGIPRKPTVATSRVPGSARLTSFGAG
jgi:transcription antitermination factor NusG